MCLIFVYIIKDKKICLYCLLFNRIYLKQVFEYKKFKDSVFKYQKLGDIINYFMFYFDNIFLII